MMPSTVHNSQSVVFGGALGAVGAIMITAISIASVIIIAVVIRQQKRIAVEKG